MLMKVLFERRLSGLELMEARDTLYDISVLIPTGALNRMVYDGHTYVYMEFTCHGDYPPYETIRNRLKGSVARILIEIIYENDEDEEEEEC